MLQQTLYVLRDKEFAELFAPGSRAEVPIVGRIDIAGKAIPVSGRVDRLAVTPKAVLIGDFKTGNPTPARIETYTRQLAPYRALLEKIYPGRTVRAVLIWTEATDLVELSPKALDAALSRVTSP